MIFSVWSGTDAVATDGVDVGMPPEVAVDLATELIEETDILPTSRDRDSDTDALPPQALTAMEVDAATREISRLLLEILSEQPPASEAAASGLAPSSACPQAERPRPG